MALLGRAFLAHAAGTSDALPVARASVAACNAAGGDWPLGYALCMLARALTEHGRLERARAAIARAQSLFDATGEQEGIAFADQLLGGVHLRAGQLDAAERLLLSARERFRRLRGDLDAGYTLIDLARVALAQRRPSDATEHATQALVDFRRRGDPRGVSGALLCLGRANGLLLDEALALARRWGYPVNAAEAESALARLTTSARLGVGGEEPELGARVEALGAHDVAALPGVGEQRDGDVRVAEKLR
jgi:tetratricopeptide (TPR) repeat protein